MPENHRLTSTLRNAARFPGYLAERFREIGRHLWDLEQRIRSMQEALGRIESRQLEGLPAEAVGDAEFRVYSQWGEDGIIDHLCRVVPIRRRVFVEFGVEDYEEANTRFLLTNRGWSGLVLDADPAGIRRLRSSRVYWRHNIKAQRAMITRENIDGLFHENGLEGEIGLLSIDIDGMDYWVWDAIEVVRPTIVVIEYNHLFGPELAATVPYDAEFDRRRAHHSLIYYGASLAALARLGERKGYDLIACNSAGLNAFFVRSDRRPESLPARTVAEAFVPGSFNEAHDEHGRRIDMAREEQQRLVMSLPLVDVSDPSHPKPLDPAARPTPAD